MDVCLSHKNVGSKRAGTRVCLIYRVQVGTHSGETCRINKRKEEQAWRRENDVGERPKGLWRKRLELEE